MTSTEEILMKTQLILTRYILPICFFFGVTGNIFNITIFLKPPLRANPSSIYFIATSFVNLLIIHFGIIPTIYSSYRMEPALYLSWACKLKLYCLHSFLMMSRTYIVLACLDQYMHSSSDARLRKYSNHRIALKLLPVVVIVWFLIPIHMLVFVDIQRLYVNCGTSGTYGFFYSIYSFIFSSLPLILMIIFSSLAVYNIRQIHRRIGPVHSHQILRGDYRSRKYNRQMMIILMCQVIIYLISTSLHPSNTLYTRLTAVPIGGSPKSSLRLAIEGFISYLTWGFLVYINSCASFYISFCASKAFRSRFYKLLHCIFTCTTPINGIDVQRPTAVRNISTRRVL